MEFLLHAPSSYYQSFKSYWRKRKYQRLTGTRYNSIKKKLKITRLGSRSRPSHRHYSKLTTLSTAPKLGPKILSPIKMLSKFHDGYVTMMVRLAGSLDRSAGSSAMGGNKVKKGQQVALASTGEEVDSRLVMEIYKKFAASREMTLRF
ncbi:hypothetical protein SAY86_001701 [Trapa natans]|uniref:Uncharacterized protein n=1 Tax=Trapa natans TaxID=22666 RepID=A0AAN7QZR0_TRANT|nr:hypothetical protein SAY86_001701 [Trapa natans]